MVSLAIGLVVIGAVFTNYLNNSSGSAQTAALAQVTEDATLALGILRNHVAMAGFSHPTQGGQNGMTLYLDKYVTLFGCDGGQDIAALITDTPSAPNPAAWVCGNATPGSTSDALLVQYEADQDSMPTTGNPPIPLDCAGNSLTADSAGFFIANNRFYVDTTANSLYCQGSGNKTPLVENITDMHIQYGVGESPNGSSGTRSLNIFTYETAGQISGSPPIPGTQANNWGKVASVRICVMAQSTTAVLTGSDSLLYRDCANQVQMAADHRIHRAFTTTIVLNNRVGVTASSVATPPTSSGS